ncbi:MAG: hypothetical protein JRN39_03995 [Nitrososphaerota archaeon]|nr:hypothetical protein [Nitrososphaerota archaeon]
MSGRNPSSGGPRRLLLVLLIAVPLAFVAAYSWHQSQTGPAPVAVAKVYRVELFVSDDAGFGQGVGAQPRYSVLVDGVLQSSANISLPAFTPIELIIVNNDTRTNPASDDMGAVDGAVGGKVVFNYTNDGRTYGSVPLSSVPADQLSHTFTIPQLGVSIPVTPFSVVVAHLYFDKTGTFYWMCWCPCGYEAMVTPGWMSGQVTVHAP